MKFTEDHSVDISQQVVCSAPYLERGGGMECMHGDVNQHCKTCPQCVIVTGAGRPGHPPLQPIPVSKPFQIMGIDIMDLPRTTKGNKHVVVVQDFLTKINGLLSSHSQIRKLTALQD